MPALVIAGTLVVGVGAGSAIVATRQSPNPGRGALRSVTGAQARKAKSAHRHHAAPAGPLRVTSIMPSSGRTAGWRAAVTVRFSQPLAQSTPLPTLLPAVAGSWDRVGPSTLRFHPVGQYVPFTKETVSVPAAARSKAGKTLGNTVVSHFTVAGASVLRLQELLAELGYLPVDFVPRGAGQPAAGQSVGTSAPASLSAMTSAPAITGTTVVAAPGPGTTTDIEPSSAGDISLSPLAGHFAWRFHSIPAGLAAQWTAGQANMVTTGAVMAFESAHGLGADGVAGPLVWGAVLKAAAARQITTAPYDYVSVSEALPQHVTIWRDGVNVFTTLANTGIAQAPTAKGTWPVYVRYLVTTMSGTEPNGQHYSDPGIPWVSYFNGGDALHGYIRPGYGYPQSLGCVEMQYSAAKTVYPYTPLGTLVTVA